MPDHSLEKLEYLLYIRDVSDVPQKVCNLAGAQFPSDWAQ